MTCPCSKGCAAWIVFRVVPELHNQEAYDLFIGEAVAAFADDRVFVNGRWNFEEAPDDLRTRTTWPAAFLHHWRRA